MTDIEIFKNVTDVSTLDEKQIAKITARLPEYKRGSAIIGHSTSQSSYSLQTMQMISDSPLSRMKQCLAQINKKYNALQEAYYKLEKKKLSLDALREKNDKYSRLNIEQSQNQIESMTVSMNTALREIGMFQNMYDSIKKNNNIPDDWSEKDYESQEIDNMTRSCFRIGIQDLSASGRVSKAFVEYCEQLGIHPQLAETLIRGYMIDIQNKVVKQQKVTIVDMYEFLDSMVVEFKDGHKDALARMGLDELGSEEFMAKGHTKPQ